MIANIVIVSIVYFCLGGLISSAMLNEYNNISGATRAGLTLLWPMFVLKGIGWLFWESLVGIGGFVTSNLSKWWVVPVVIGKVFINGFKALIFGLGESDVRKELRLRTEKKEKLALELGKDERYVEMYYTWNGDGWTEFTGSGW